MKPNEFRELVNKLCDVAIKYHSSQSLREEIVDALWAHKVLPDAQPAQSVKDAIIDDLQSQFDSEGITEHDSGDALIRLSDAIAAVEDNFVQPAPSVPDGWLRAIDEALVTAHIGVANAHDTYEQAKAKLDNLIGFHVGVATDPAVNGGWKLVPIKPTEEMIYKVIDERLAALVSGKDHSMLDIYHAMLAAAPEAKK